MTQTKFHLDFFFRKITQDMTSELIRNQQTTSAVSVRGILTTRAQRIMEDTKNVFFLVHTKCYYVLCGIKSLHQ